MRVKLMLLTMLLLSTVAACAEQAKKEEWHNTVLSDDTIKKIQDAKYQYNKCVVNEMQKSDYVTIDTRNATEAIIKQCEKILGDIRKVYLDEKVPEVIADRHLKQIRTQTTRGVLQQMIYLEATRKSNALDKAAAK